MPDAENLELGPPRALVSVRQWWAVIIMAGSIVSTIAAASYQLSSYQDRLTRAEAGIAQLQDNAKHVNDRLDGLRDQARDQVAFRTADIDQVVRLEGLVRSLVMQGDQLRDGQNALHEALATEHERVGFVLDRIGVSVAHPQTVSRR